MNASNDRVARTLAALDYDGDVDDCDGEPFIDITASPEIRRTAAGLDCSLAVAAYITVLENRVASLEEKVSELRYDVRRVRRAA